MNYVRLKSNPSKKQRPATPRVLAALCAHTALAEMINGTARREEWQDCADAVNVVDALAALNMYDMAAVRPLVDQSIEGLTVAIKCPDGMMRMGSEATKALKQVVCMYDDGIRKFSRSKIDEAWKLVTQKIAMAGLGCDPSVVVVDA